MITEKIILALIASASLLTIVLVSIFVIRFGLRIECGWLYFRILTAPKQDVPSKEAIDAEIRNVVQETLKTQLTALDSYKDNMKLIEESMRAVLAQRLADISVIHSKTTEANLINLATRMELLLINTENHYTQVSLSLPDLEQYILTRYRRIYRMLSNYEVDVNSCTYHTMTQWWDIIQPTLVDTIKNKIVCCSKMATISAGLLWEDSFEKETAHATERLHVLTSATSLDDILRRHQCYVPSSPIVSTDNLLTSTNSTDIQKNNTKKDTKKKTQRKIKRKETAKHDYFDFKSDNSYKDTCLGLD